MAKSEAVCRSSHCCISSPTLHIESLMLVGGLVGAVAVVVEAGSGHPRFEVANRGLGFSDARLERLNLCLPRLLRTGLAARFGLETLPLVA